MAVIMMSGRRFITMKFPTCRITLIYERQLYIISYLISSVSSLIILYNNYTSFLDRNMSKSSLS